MARNVLPVRGIGVCAAFDHFVFNFPVRFKWKESGQKMPRQFGTGFSM
jgi:hypothetical protein